MSLDDTDTGVAVNGVLWTSHATQFNIVLVKFDVTADFYDASGNLLGSSDTDTPCHIEISEMQSGEIALAWTTDKKAADIGSVTVHVTSEIVTNAPGQEN